MGRPRKPTAQHAIDNTLRPDRENVDEPVYQVTAPDKPTVVSGRVAASAEWDRIVPILVAQRVLTVADLSGLVGYCSAFADLVEMEAIKASPGYTPLVHDISVDRKGVEHRRERAHPAIVASIHSASELRQWATQLGLTPASRAKVSSAPAPTVSAFAQFAAKRRRTG